MSDWKERLTGKLERLLEQRDPRASIATYHNLPYAIFQYEPEVELDLRKEIPKLVTRLERKGKRVTVVSLADCLLQALRTLGLDADQLSAAEDESGPDALIDTLHHLLSHDAPLDALVAERVPPDAAPDRDLVFLVRAGALFPFYRTSALLERMMGRVQVPCILFFPGRREGPAGLSFMGVLDPEHNYRAHIY